MKSVINGNGFYAALCLTTIQVRGMEQFEATADFALMGEIKDNMTQLAWDDLEVV